MTSRTADSSGAKKQRIQSMASSNQDVSGLVPTLAPRNQDVSDESLAPRIQDFKISLLDYQLRLNID